MTTLSPELKVACEIWHYNTLNEPISFTELIESLKPHMEAMVVSQSLDTLEDWLIAYSEYGRTDNNHIGRLWFIDTHGGGDFRIRDLYEKYWRDERCKA